MKFFKIVGAAITAVLLMAGGALAEDSTVDRYLAEMNAIADALETITDDESAAAAAEVMGAALERLEPISEEMQAWSEDQKMDFIRGYAEEYMGAHSRISRALSQMVLYPERMKLFSEHMRNIPRLN